jgi:hypothetical protein
MLGVVFIEERNGRALVRLPNGSKTSVLRSCLRPKAGRVHFARDLEGEGETVYCQACEWSVHAPTRVEAEDSYLVHVAASHPER